MMVRALTFRKNFAHHKHERNWWALVGHSDELESSSLGPMTLADIREFNDAFYKQDTANSYHHVLFLIDAQERQADQQRDEVLWSSDDKFMSITRIHFPKTTDLNEQFKKITKYFSYLSKETNFKEIDWRTYYTVELSDMVVVGCSDSLQTLSQWALNATKTKRIASAYTYFCIPGAFIKSSSTSLPKHLKEDRIDFLAIRFAVMGGKTNKELTRVRQYLGEELTSPVFRVAGNEDAIICGQNVPVENLVKLYQRWYANDSRILNSFRDVITRLGAEWMQTPPHLALADYEHSESQLERCSKTVLKKVQDNEELCGRLKDRVWLRPMVSLTNVLVQMSRSATLDEAVLLILPGVKAFWDNIFYDTENKTDDIMYSRFAELCIHTVEHLMRAEGQLSHRPEMRPLSYDLPIFVLEYATSFLLILSKVLTAADGDKAEKIRFLLVPSSGVAVSTEELFEAEMEKGIPGLIQITIPFSLLYSPKELLPALCHEMAHYIGEKIRRREKRYECFLQSVATGLIKYFFDNVSDPDCKFHDFLTHDFLDNAVREWARRGAAFGIEEVTTISLQEIVMLIKVSVEDQITGKPEKRVDFGKVSDPKAVNHVSDVYAALVRKYILSDKAGAKFYALPQAVLENHFQAFFDFMNDLFTCYREAYADICMLYLLDLTDVEYLEVSVTQLKDIPTGTLIRVYASLSTAHYSLEQIKKAFDVFGQAVGADEDKKNNIHAQLTEIDDRVHGTKNTAEKYLIDYLKCCWCGFESEKIDATLPEQGDTVNDIYKILTHLSDNIEYPEILSIIDRGRKETIENILQ